jgi:hypothetical protein
MYSESCNCGFCQENSNRPFGADVQDSQWLEEMGEMMLATAERMRTVRTQPCHCCETVTGA